MIETSRRGPPGAYVPVEQGAGNGRPTNLGGVMSAAAEKKSQELQLLPPATPEHSITPMQLLQMAMSQNADFYRLEKLLDMQMRWEASEAKKAFVSAMAAFKADPP